MCIKLGIVELNYNINTEQILCGEVLAIAIREQQDTKGSKIGNKEIKITQYADDTSLSKLL